MFFQRKLLINSKFILNSLKQDKIILVDAGARGTLFEPFNKVNSNILKVILFEPDNTAKVEVSNNKIYFNKGIWCEKVRKTLFLSKKGSNSSIYEPDKNQLKGFLGFGSYFHRKPVNTIEVELDSLENLFSKSNISSPDFIKLDIHGSEYEALLGSKNFLKKSTFGVLVESWSSPIHKNQKLSSDVEQLLNKFNFYIFDYLSLFRWERKNLISTSSKRQIIFLEALYFKNLEKINSRNQALKFISILDLYGYYEYLSFSLSYFIEKKIISSEDSIIIFKLLKKNQSFFRNLFLKNVLFFQKVLNYLYNKF